MEISEYIKQLNLSGLNKDEAECVIYAWLLKTKLYLIGETSHEWSEEGKALLKHELGVITDKKLEDWKP